MMSNGANSVWTSVVLVMLAIMGLIGSTAASSWCNTQPTDDRYLVITEFKANFIKANEFCARIGLRLASVTSQTDQNALTLAVQRAVMNGAPSNVAYFLGATNLATKGTYVWLHSGQTVTFTKWSIGQPDNYDNKENCLTLWEYEGWSWNDLNCNVENFFVCEGCPWQPTCSY